jgi:hypothetical protein
MIDDPLEKLLEDLDNAKRRLETRERVIQEAFDELPHAESVRLENYLGFGRSLRINEEVREALRGASADELLDLKTEIEDIRQRIMIRRTALADLPPS